MIRYAQKSGGEIEIRGCGTKHSDTPCGFGDRNLRCPCGFGGPAMETGTDRRPEPVRRRPGHPAAAVRSPSEARPSPVRPPLKACPAAAQIPLKSRPVAALRTSAAAQSSSGHGHGRPVSRNVGRMPPTLRRYLPSSFESRPTTSGCSAATSCFSEMSFGMSNSSLRPVS